MSNEPVPERPDWLFSGNEVIMFARHPRPGTSQNPVETQVARVAKLSFTVEAVETRFRVRDQSALVGGAWGTTLTVIPANCPEAQEVLLREAARRKVVQARLACETWMKKQTPDTRLAAIEALQAVEDLA